MKRGLLIGAVVGAVAVSGLMMKEYCFSHSDNIGYYTPRVKEAPKYEYGWAGASEYLESMRVNQVTGEIDPADVLAARAQANKMERMGKTGAIGLQWENLGPNNIGGRTRAIIYDQSNPEIIYAGSVSGGLFKSTNGGNSWTQVNDMAENLAVVSLAQAPDGTIYYGTGEGMYASSAGRDDITNASLGGGLFKSTDGGNTFQLVASTEPVANTTSAEFAAIGKIVIDPNNSQRIFLATNRGIRRSDDGGLTWVNPLSPLSESALDMVGNSTGGIWLKQGRRVYFSPTGDNGSFNEVDGLPITNARARLAVAPTDDNYVYCVIIGSDNGFSEAYQTTDGGANWARIGQRSPLLNPHRTQGRYNNALAVSPLDKERIIVGGVELWEWSSSNGWLQIASLGGASVGSPFYVHADDHAVAFHPTRPNEILIGNDGGVFKSVNNGVTWAPLNREYVTTQFFSIGVGKDGELLGGTQDNGTLFVSPESFFSRQGVRTNSINFKGSLRDGDGGFAEISHLNPLVAFKEMQYGVLGRTSDSGNTFNEFYDYRRMDPEGFAGDGTSNFASFVMPFLLWEKLDDPLSEDSLTFVADSAVTSLGFGNGGTSYSGQMQFKQASTKFVSGGFTIEVANTNISLQAGADDTLRGDGTGYFDVNTGQFTVTFNQAVTLEIVAKAATRYDAGSVLFLNSATNDLPINYTLGADLEPNESVKIQDPVQSTFFVGLRAYDQVANPNRNRKGGIWMTREALSKPLTTPEWFHIADLGNNETPMSMQISHDGNTLYVGTTQGRLYRITNINAARDSASTDIDDVYLQGNLDRTNTSVIETDVIRTFGGRAITGIAVNSQNLNQVVVTLGNYGNTRYVERTNNALAANPIFTNITGDLPPQPYYAATFNYNDPTGEQLILGGEDGIYTTEDVNAANVTYTKENDGFANVPVFDLRQPRTIRYDLKTNQDFEGTIYAGTYGRGFYRTNTTADYISIDEPDPVVAAATKEALNIFPNPASDRVNIKLNLTERSDVKLTVRDLSGKLVKAVSLDKVDKGVDQLPLDVSGLRNGTYIVMLQINNKATTGKLIVTH